MFKYYFGMFLEVLNIPEITLGAFKVVRLTQKHVKSLGKAEYSHTDPQPENPLSPGFSVLAQMFTLRRRMSFILF